MSERQSQKQKEQWRSYVFSKLSGDIDDQENIRRIREDVLEDDGRDLGIKEYLERLKELHKQAGQ